MKLFSEYIQESCCTADVNPGNGLGVTNHLTPVQNIVTNLKNLFCTMPVVFSVAEDGFSIKMNSSEFTSEQKINDILYQPVYQNQSIYTYVCSQGLNSVRPVNLGMFWVVYMSPTDIVAADPLKEPVACQESLDDIDILVTESSDDEEEITDINKKKLKEVLQDKDKVKAAKQLSILISQEISLPNEYYFAGVRNKGDNEESIALRWKYIKRRPKGLSTEVTHTLMNIFGTGNEAVWVGDFDKNAKFELPKETKKLIDSILEFIGAEKTSDPCVFSITDDKDKKKEDKKEEDDNEDDKSRGDDSDNN